MATQLKISQAQKEAIKRIRKVQDKALAGKIGDETVMIGLDCDYHHWNSTCKPSINVSLPFGTMAKCRSYTTSLTQRPAI